MGAGRRLRRLGSGSGLGRCRTGGLGLRLWVHLRLQPDMELCDGVELSPLYYAFHADLGLFDRLELSGIGCLSRLWPLARGLLNPVSGAVEPERRFRLEPVPDDVSAHFS
jgi:hypothetical protein